MKPGTRTIKVQLKLFVIIMPKTSIKQQIIDCRISRSILAIELIENIAFPDYCHDAIDEEMDDLMEDLTTIISCPRGYELHLPKSFYSRENVLSSFNDGRFLQMLRVSKSQFARLISMFSTDIAFQSRNMNLQLPVDLQLAIVLYRLGSTGAISTMFEVGDGGTLNKITERVFSAILKKMKDYIHWPNPAERRQLVAQTFHELPYCIGYVDGCEIKLAEKPKTNHEVYFSRHGIYSIKLQVVCDHKLRIMHAQVGSPGSYADSKVFKKSRLGTETDRLFCGEEWIAGDSAYQLQKHLLTPYRRNSTFVDAEQQAEFNKRHSQYRVRVENCFGILKEKFCSLKEMRLKIKNKKSQVFFNKWVLVCCVLHNILLEDRNFSQFANVANDTSTVPHDMSAIAAPTPELKRQALYNLIFH